MKKSSLKIWKYEKKYISLHCKHENLNIFKLEIIFLTVMETKIFVIGIPTFGNVAEKIGEALSQVFEKPEPCRCKPAAPRWTPPAPCRPVAPQRPACGAPAPEWGIAGTPACENKRFGYGLEVDEPRCEDYAHRWQFESDHAAFDKFVEAGEDCIARGLAKKSDAPITKCEAIRQPVNCPPPMRDEVPGGELIGETHWWECTGW